MVRRAVRPARSVIRGLARFAARSVLKRRSLAITTVANTRDLLQGFILTYVAAGARSGPTRAGIRLVRQPDVLPLQGPCAGLPGPMRR